MEQKPYKHCVGIGANYGYPGDIAKGDQGDFYIKPSSLTDPTWSNVDDAVTWIQNKVQELTKPKGEKS